jgi:hypothetical protein
MPVRNPGIFPDDASNMAGNPENSVRVLPYSHSNVPYHVAHLRKQAESPQAQRSKKREKALPMQGVIFDSRQIDLFNEALRNPDHRLRQAAERAMQGFTVAAEKAEITTLNRAASEYHIPHKNLSEWVAKGVIPYESRDQYAIYVRREILDKVAPVYHHAKEQGKLAAPILKKMRDDLFPAPSTSPRE